MKGYKELLKSDISTATVPQRVMTHQITMEKRLNSGHIHATSHSSMMLSYRNPSTVQEAHTHIQHID